VCAFLSGKGKVWQWRVAGY